MLQPTESDTSASHLPADDFSSKTSIALDECDIRDSPRLLSGDLTMMYAPSVEILLPKATQADARLFPSVRPASAFDKDWISKLSLLGL
jgi:hypothetical protein